MNPIDVTLLQWLGLSMPPRALWELLSLNRLQLEEFLKLNKANLPSDWSLRIKKMRESCIKNSIQLIPLWHPHYPSGLKKMSKPPWVLSCLGKTESLNKTSLAVVGSRKLNYESARWMETELSRLLESMDILICSGGAFGVDQKAHSLSILHNKPTVCWLPSGLLDLYPAVLNSMAKDIIDSNGVLVSTYPPQQRMRKYHFVQRNQFIAASSILTFIVQAKRKSGTLITAKAAADLGKEVAVLPSAPNAEGLGGLDLIYDGAHMVRSAEDLIALLEELMAQKSAPLIQAET